MLLQLGALTMEVWPFNATGYTRDTSADFAPKDIMGAMRPREFMGEGDETMSIDVRLFPEKLGGLEQLAILHQMRNSGIAQILVRGDGANLGWFLIESVSERSSYLDANGIGRLVECGISLVRSPKPTPLAYIPTLLRLFQWA